MNYYDDERPQPHKPSFVESHYLTIAFSVTIILFLVFSSFTIVGAGHRGVKVTLGAVDMIPLNEGLHLKWFFQNVIDVDVRTVKFIQENADSSSKDLQVVLTDVALNYHVNPDQASILYQEIGMDFESRIIIPAIQDSLKSVMAQFSAAELINDRPAVKLELERMLRERLTPFYISVDMVSFENFKLSDIFIAAAESKVTAEQKMLQAEMDLLRIEIEAKQAVAQGQAEATVFKLKTDSMSPELVEMERLKVELVKWTNWDGKLPLVMGDATPIVDMRTIAAIV